MDKNTQNQNDFSENSDKKVVELSEEATQAPVAQKHELKHRFVAFLEKRQVRMVFSLLVSLILWCFVSMNSNVEQSVTIRNVPIAYKLPSAAENLGLSIVEKDIETVDVTVTGNRYLVGQLDAGKLTAIVQPTSVTGASTCYVPVAVKINGSGFADVKISVVSPGIAMVRLDRIVEREFNLTAKTNDYGAGEGYELSSPTLEDKTVMVSGPQGYLDKIDHVVAMAEVDSIVSKTSTYSAKLILYDSNDKEIAYRSEQNPNNSIQLSIDSTEMTIIAYKTVSLPVVVNFIHEPKELPAFVISPEKVKVAVPYDMLNKLSEINVGTVDFYDVVSGNTTLTFDLNAIPTGCTLRSDISEVSVALKSSVVTKIFSVNRFEVINEDKAIGDVSMITKSVDIMVSGSSSSIAKLKSDDIVVQIDAGTIIGAGSHEVPANVLLGSLEDCWVNTPINVWIKMTADE